jgi:hypothetical protein
MTYSTLSRPCLCRLSFLATVFLLFFPLESWSAPGRATPAQVRTGTGKAEVLDQKKIHGDYNEGNFEVVISALEAYLQRNNTYSRGDSVFIAKHLAVVYSANPATREKGKYYMNRLLELMPSAKLVDMYVSDEIDRIFDKVREEFLSRQRSFGVEGSMVVTPDKAPRNADEAGADNPPSGELAGGSKPGKKSAKAGSSNSGYWIAAGTGVVAAGVLAYYLVTENEDNKAEDKIYVVP